MNQKRILYEDQDIIVCHKAAGIATQTARVGQADMVSEVSLYLKPVPDTPDCLDILRFGGFEFDLFPDLLNMHRDCGNIPDGLHIPDLAEQFFFGIYVIGVLRKECQQVEFLRRKNPLLPVHINSSGRLVDLNLSM